MFYRFLIACILVLGVTFLYSILIKKDSGENISLLSKKGWILGLFLFGGYLFQTVGLRYTTPSNAAFITSLSVILVPCVMIFRGNKVTKPVILSVSLAFIGLAFLTIDFTNIQVNPGDIIILGTAISIALQIVLTGEFVKEESALNLSLTQLLSMTVLSFVFAIIFEPTSYRVLTNFSNTVIYAVIFTAILATSYAYFVQTFSQKTINAIVIAIIYTLEPIFALIISLLLQIENLTIARAIGMTLILLGTFIAIIQENRQTSIEFENQQSLLKIE